MVDDQNDMLSEAFNDLKETNAIMGSANENLKGQGEKLQHSKAQVNSKIYFLAKCFEHRASSSR